MYCIACPSLKITRGWRKLYTIFLFTFIESDGYRDLNDNMYISEFLRPDRLVFYINVTENDKTEKYFTGVCCLYSQYNSVHNHYCSIPIYNTYWWKTLKYLLKSDLLSFSCSVNTGAGTLETAMLSTSISRQNRIIQIVKKLSSLGKFSCSSIYILDPLDRLEQTQKVCLIKLEFRVTKFFKLYSAKSVFNGFGVLGCRRGDKHVLWRRICVIKGGTYRVIDWPSFWVLNLLYAIKYKCGFP